MSEIAEIIKNINEASKVLRVHIASGEREDHQGSAPSVWFEDESN